MLKIFIDEKYFIIYTPMLSKYFPGSHAALLEWHFLNWGLQNYSRKAIKHFKTPKLSRK